jgi:hypothetical protein
MELFLGFIVGLSGGLLLGSRAVIAKLINNLLDGKKTGDVK